MNGEHGDLLFCDLTQSYAPHGGGGISTYLREKRRHVLERTGHRLLQIVPGPEDRIVQDGRHIWAEIAAEPVRGSPNYRFILRTAAVREVLARFQPDVIESQCPWVLPWTAINHRRAHPTTVLVAGYHTDFPNVHVGRVGTELFGKTVAGGLRRLTETYAGVTYREFDRVYTLSGQMRGLLRGYGVPHVDLLDLGVDTELFSPTRRDPGFRARMGLPGNGPLLGYAGRIDNERKADQLIAMMRQLPGDLGAALIMFGDGKLRERLVEEARDLPVLLPGFVSDRHALADALASCDIYVSAMADETFGISVVEAQASGLPVVGVASGAMPERVWPGVGLLAQPGDVAAMARHVETIWAGDPAAMGRAARAHVDGQFSWERSFGRLFGEVYPKAFAASQDRQRVESAWATGWRPRRAG